MNMLMLIQDSLPVAVDSVKAMADSAGAVIGDAIGAEIGGGVAVALMAAIRVVMGPAKMLIGKYVAMGGFAKSMLALVLSQALVLANAYSMAHGGPAIPMDVEGLEAVIPGLVLWLGAMGLNTLIDVIRDKMKKDA